MLTKAKRFFTNPIYLLATIVAVAVVGLGSMFAVRAFADGEVPTVPNGLTTGESAHYDTATIDYLYLNNSYDWAQVYCSESETVEAELTHNNGLGDTLSTSSFQKDYAPFNVREYDSNNDGTDDTNYSESTVTITSALPDKTYYVFQYDEDYNEYYVGSFNIQNSTLLRKIFVYDNGTEKSNYYDNHQLIADCGLDTSDVANTVGPTGTYSASNSSTSVYDAKGEYSDDGYGGYEWTGRGNYFSGGYASSILYKAGFDFNGAAYSFVGLKQKTYYKYGSRITPNNSNVVVGCNYVKNVSVILPKSTATGSRSYIGYGWDGDSDENVMDISNNQFFPIDRRNLSDVLGIPGNVGTIMTAKTGSGYTSLPVQVNVHYSVAAPADATLTNNGGLNDHEDTAFSNLHESEYILSGGISGEMTFQPDSSHSTPQCTIGSETKDATGWESVNDNTKTFGLSSSHSVRSIFSANNYTVNFNGGLITLTVPVKAVFPASATYTVTYHANEGTGDDYPVSNIASGGSYTVLANTDSNLNYSRDGYTFTGWNTESGGGGTAYSAGNLITVNANVDLYAQWKKNYTLNYHSNLTGVDDPASVTFYADDTSGGQYTFENKSVNKDGYTFKGWGTATNATTAVTAIDFSDTTYTYDVYGIWQNTVTYQDGYTNDTSNDQTYDVVTGQSHSIISNPFTREGYDFAGWELVSPASGYATSGSITVNENVTYKATWTAKTYTLHYIKNLDTASEPSPASETFTIENVSGGKYTFTNQTLTADGYTFGGWGATSPTTDAITAIDFNANQESYYVYGIWAEKDYTLTYDKNLDAASAPSVASQSFKLSNCTKNGTTYTYTFPASTTSATGYDFVGWSESGSAPAAESITVNPDTLSYTVMGIWTIHTHNVTYTVTGDVPGGYTKPADQTNVAYNTEVTVAGVPNVDGYTFSGWTVTGATVTSGKFNMPDNDVTISGVFTQNPVSIEYTLTYDPNNGTATGNQFSTIGAVGNMPSPVSVTLHDSDFTDGKYTLKGASIEADKPTASGFDFVCWCKTPNHSAASVRTAVTKDDFDADHKLTVYAIWITHIEVTYQKNDEEQPIDETGAGSNNNPSSDMPQIEVTYAFKLDINELAYRVLDIDALKAENENFDYDATKFKFDYWEVIEGGDKITVKNTGASGGSSASALRRSGAGEVTVLRPGWLVELSGNIKLLAHFVPVSSTTPDPTPTPSNVKLTYDANGGTGDLPAGNPFTYSSGDTVTVAGGGNLEKNGMKFAYWSTSSNDESGSRHYAENSKFTITKDTVLYAVYGEKPSGSGSYTVTYNANGGKGTTPTDSNQYAGGETVTVASKGDLVRADCTFKEWNTAKDGSGTGYKGDGTDTFTMPESNVTLYAIWLDGDGNYASPPTGESDAFLLIALSMTALALLAGAYAVIRKRQANGANA